MKKLFALLIINIWLFQLIALSAMAQPEWPLCPDLQAEGAAVMDMDSGALLYGKSSHTVFPPASITKILTALLVIENCEMDEMVTFSDDAVNNVEAGSSNAELSVGDRLTVEACLYAMLLKSANEAANALAEHVSGSRSAFVDLMNERIVELGCEDSHFANPSGLNSDEQNVSPYDMCLIAREAFRQPELVKIASTLKYDLPPTIRNPEGYTIYMEHKMLLSGQYHYDAAKAGKTGYTRLAGNTLVTYAEKDGRRLAAVALKDKYPNHYPDTKAMLEFGFEQFDNYNISQNTRIMEQEDQTVTADGIGYHLTELTVDPNAVITLPVGVQFSAAEETLVTDLPLDHPEEAVAMLRYTYRERLIGQACLYRPVVEAPSEPETTEAPPAETVPARPDGTAQKGSGFSKVLFAAAAVLVLLGGGAVYVLSSRRKEREELERRRARRRERLKDIGYSEEEFNHILKEMEGSGRKDGGAKSQREKASGGDKEKRKSRRKE